MNDTKPSILDVTVRDGSYAINFQYTTEQVKEYVARLQSAGIRWAEVSHGISFGAQKAGFTSRMTDIEQISAASEVARSAKDPINLGIFCMPSLFVISDVRRIAERISFVRLAVKVTDPEPLGPVVEALKKLGLKVFIQMVRASAIEPAKASEIALLMKGYGVDIVYVVDTAGCLLPGEVGEYIKRSIDKIGDCVGFHAHNNLGLALANTLEAIKAGATFVDSSLKGMGRGAGNVPTEMLVMALKRIGFTLNIDERQLVRAADRLHEKLLQFLPRPSGYDAYTAVKRRDFFPFYLLEAVANEMHVPLFDVLDKLSGFAPGVEISIEDLGGIINGFGHDKERVFRAIGLIS